MFQLFHVIFYQPLYNALIWLYNIIPGHDLGIAIILLTILIRLLLYPLNSVSIKSQKALQDIQPKIKAIREKFASNKEQQAKELLNLYREHKVNPFSSCLPLLIQFPFLIGLFLVFQSGIKGDSFKDLYSFVATPETLNHISFGFLNIVQASPVLAIIAGGLQFWQTRMLMHSNIPQPQSAGKDESMMASMNKQMMYLMPAMTVFIGWTFPSGLMLYWSFSTAFSIVQQYIVFQKRSREANKQPVL
ncbi:MAG TPA: YidC/Oxa1 family membrane protein insertase [Patescibacteria group bacterium]|nr:YidC/Oxa1 family membrane protein insertase [Patescibacteria group bacterium]